MLDVSLSACMGKGYWFLFYPRAFMSLCLETPFPPDLVSFSRRLSSPGLSQPVTAPPKHLALHGP